MYYTKSERNINLNKIQHTINSFWKVNSKTSIICGDMNTDIKVEKPVAITNILRKNNFELISNNKNEKKFTYESGGSKSFIDHFFISKQ